MFLLSLDGLHVLTSVDDWCCGDCVGLGFVVLWLRWFWAGVSNCRLPFVTVSLTVCILLYWFVFVFYFAGLFYVTVFSFICVVDLIVF